MKHTLKRCPECGGQPTAQAIVHTQPWGERLYRFENVPALVCTQCGHTLLDAAVSQEIEKIIHGNLRPTKYHRVPEFSLSRQPKS